MNKLINCVCHCSRTLCVITCHNDSLLHSVTYKYIILISFHSYCIICNRLRCMFQYNVMINISCTSLCTSLPICVSCLVLIPSSLSLSLSLPLPPSLSLNRRMFGNLTELRGDKYASAIDSAPPDVFVVIHIYDEVILLLLVTHHYYHYILQFFITCVKLNRCLADLAKKYPTVCLCVYMSLSVYLYVFMLI